MFVEARLRALAARAEVKVVAPVPILDYAKRGAAVVARHDFPTVRQSGNLEVLHPRWVYPPGGTPFNIGCMYLRLLPLLTSLRRRFPFDLIDAHFCYPEGVVAAALARSFQVPFSITLRGSETMFAGYRYRLRMMEAALRQASAVVAVSDNLADFASAHGAGSNRVFTIPNGVDKEIFYPRPRQRDNSSYRLIVSAGELIEAKGHHLVLRAMRRLVDAGHDLRLIIAGKTGRGGACYESELRGLVEQLSLGERVQFAGWLDRYGLAEVLSQADVFCLASYTEGWPNVVHEALSCGAPVVGTDVGGMRSLVPDVQYGFVVPARNEMALESALSAALSKHWNRDAIAAHGRRRDWNCVAAEVESVFHDVLRFACCARAVEQH